MPEEQEQGVGGEAVQAAAATASAPPELEELQKQAAEYKDSWLRAAADLQNYRKRVERERAELSDWANARLLLQLLEVMDGFDAAFAVVPDKFRGEAWVEGLRLVQQKLHTLLAQEKVKPIEALGKPFDPNYHEAMWQEESPGHAEGEILAEFQRGYLLGERVLRPTRVKVATASRSAGGEATPGKAEIRDTGNAPATESAA